MFGQTPSSVLGTVVAVRVEAGQIEWRPDNTAAPVFTVGPRTVLLRVAPGARDLQGAETILLSGIEPGDRLLVTFQQDPGEARRVVVMSAKAIESRNEADRLDWLRHGVSGVVAEKNGSEIVVRVRSLAGETRTTLATTAGTRFRRYAPDSVRFADARPSALAEVAVGDQLRARGNKSQEGLRLTAEEVVFGTFLTQAGVVTSVDAAAGELAVKELSTSQSLKIKVTADSQIKKMSIPGGPANGPPDFSQMFEHMPDAKLGDLRLGDTVVFSSAKSAASGQATAILLVTNAEMLVRMAAAQAASRSQPESTMDGLGGLSLSDFGEMIGFNLSGSIP